MSTNPSNDETPRKPIRCNQGTVEEARLRSCIKFLTPMEGKRITYPLPQEVVDQALECNDE